ncbi:hypothetical protein GCM10020367_61910 [Streptomyces sannanensis]|uniref:Tn3 transposase DDE domain-containing protein n=1 Tax=Streptomyces sannanensis TaxID=285536 RepID=A0ABP6SL17_9ACTN
MRRVVALLVAEACNIGCTPVIDPGDEALTRGRLVHVDQYYLRAQTGLVVRTAACPAPSCTAICRGSGARTCVGRHIPAIGPLPGALAGPKWPPRSGLDRGSYTSRL